MPLIHWTGSADAEGFGRKHIGLSCKVVEPASSDKPRPNTWETTRQYFCVFEAFESTTETGPPVSFLFCLFVCMYVLSR